jgi:hypothetical protein
MLIVTKSILTISANKSQDKWPWLATKLCFVDIELCLVPLITLDFNLYVYTLHSQTHSFD